MRCTRELLCGRTYVVGELAPSGFGLWRKGLWFPARTYPNTVDGWFAAVDEFHELGEKDRGQRSRGLRRSG